jgi:lipopolysaccharide assembly protein A
MQLLIALPLLLLLVIFALSNPQPVSVGFWPTGYWFETPLSAAVLAGMAIAFLLGALLVWMSELGQRRRARRAEHAALLLEEQVRELKARLAKPQ